MAKPCKIIASPKLAKILNIQPNQELSYNDWARILHDGGFDTLINEEIVSIKGISPQPKAVKTSPTALSDFKAGLAKFKGAATTAQNAAERVASALKEAGIKVKMIDNEEDYNREAQKRGGGKGTEGMFISTDGVIYLNQNKLQGNWGTTIVWHEGTHPIINIIRNTNPDLFNKIVSGAKKLTADKGLQNALKFAEAYRDGMTITENSEGKFELYDGENLVDTFDSEQAAQDYIDAVVADEFIVEAIARIVDGKINIEQLPSSLRQSIVDFINNILNALGVKGRVSDTDIAQFKKLAAQVSDVLQSGRSISEIVGKENVKNFQNALTQSRLTSKEIAEKTESKTKSGEVQPSMQLTAKKQGKDVITYSGGASIEALRENKPEMYFSRALELSNTHLVNGEVEKISKNSTLDEKLKWADNIYKKAKKTVVSNLLFIYDNINEDIRNISKLWYDGANIIAQEMSSKYGITIEQASAVIATQSPQKPWFDNVHLAHFIIDFYSNNQNTIFEQSDFDYYKLKSVDPNGKPYVKQVEYLDILKKSIGKPFSELSGYDKSTMIRSRFDNYYKRNAPLRIPTGAIVNADVNSLSSFSGYDTIAKAVSVLQDGSSENISANIGNAFKVRNFYNNIVSPQTNGEVTIDTHAIAAGYMLPLGSTSPEVKFDEATYSFFADAYREAAQKRGILAREMQSITWEGARAIFPASQKTEKAKKSTKEIWNDYKNGKINIDKVQNKIKEYGKDLSITDWAKYVNEIIDRDESATYLKELPLSVGNKPSVGQRAKGSIDSRVPTMGKGNRKNVIQASKGQREEKPNIEERFTSKGGNKVVDENGNPIIVYHGTDKKFDKYSDEKLGTFFTSDKETANTYKKKYGSKEGELKSANVSIKNPIIINAKGKNWDNIEVETNKMTPEKVKMKTNEILETVRGVRFPDIFHNLTFSKEKADGLIIKNVIDPLGGIGRPIDLYIPFNTEQIKPIEKQSSVQASKGQREALKDVESTAKALEENKNNLSKIPFEVEQSLPLSELNKIPRGKTFQERLAPDYYNKLKEDIRKNGIKEPIIIKYYVKDNALRIQEGHHRIKIANELGIKAIPVKINVVWANSIKEGNEDIKGQEIYSPLNPIDIQKYRKIDYYPSNVNVEELGFKNKSKEIAEAYHKAKADGSNPQLVEAVEGLIAKSAQFSKGQRNQDLIDYVKNSLDNISPEDLSQSLQEDLGYTKEDADAIVDEAIKEKEQGKQEQKEEPKEQPKQEPFKGREKERSFTVKQFLEDPTIPEEIKEAVTEDAIYYNELPNSISVGMANKLYDLLGVDDALNAIMDDMNGMPPAIRIVLGQVIIRRAAAEGGALAEAKIILKAEAELAKRGTEYGQAIQAFSLFQWLSPEGQIMYAVKQRQAEIDAKVKEDKDKIKAKKAAVKKANQEAIEEVLDGKTGDAIDESSKAKPKETSRPKSYGENNKIVTKSRYEQLKKALKGKLFSGFSPEFIELGIYHIEAGSRKFADFSKEMIKDLGSGATKYLKDLYNAAKNEYLKEGGDASGFSDDNEIQDVENQREAEKLASFIVSRAKTKSPSLDPAKQIVATLLAKVSEKIKPEKLAKLSDIEKIALAIKNREQYADVWEKSKEIVEAKIDELEISEEEKDDMKAALQAYFDEMIGQPFSDRMLKSAVRKALKDLGTDIKDVIKRHYTVADSTKRTLVEKLIMEANLSGEDAKYLADRVEREFNAIATEKKKNALESIRTVGEKLPQNAKKTKQLEDKLIELSNLGAFSDEEFVRAYAESMGWKQVTQEDIAQLRKLAEIVEKEQDGFRRARAVEDLLAFHAKMKGVSFADLALSVWYANTLSGRKTQETNILGGIIGLGLGYVVTGIKNPRSLPQVTKAIMYGFNRGKLEGMSTLTTGYSPIRGKIDVPTALELTKFKGKYNPANALKYVTRFMKAVDVAVFEAGKEMRAYQYAKKLASEQLSGEPNAAQTQKALEILGNTKEKLAEAKAQAVQEFKERIRAINEDQSLSIKEKQEAIKQEKKDVNRRIFEILEQQRTKTADDFISKTEEYGRRLTFNYQPEGILGKVAQGVNMITGAFTPLKLVVPFTNIIANIANQSLDYTPIGFLRAGTKEGSIGEFLVRKLGFGNTKASIRGNQQFDEEYRSDMLVKASMGILLTGLVYALSQTGDDDEEPILEITADGYGNYKDNYSLKETGWQPYSIKIGNRWYSYQYTPLLPMFTFIGKLNDVQKYRKEKLNDGSWTKARIAAGAAAKSFFDNTYLSSLNAVLSTIFSDESDSMIENAMTSLMKTLSGFVLPNFYTQEAKEIESIMNIPTKELGDEFYANAIKDIPFLRDKYYAKVNALGEDIVPDTDKFVSKVVTPSQQGKVTTDDLWLLLAKNKMPIRVQSFRQFNSDGVYDPKKDEIRVIDRKEYYEYTKKRGTVIKDFMMDNYDQLSKLNDEDFRYIMDDVLTESSKIAKMNLFPDEYRVGYEENQLMKTRINQKLYERDKQKRNKK